MSSYPSGADTPPYNPAPSDSSQEDRTLALLAYLLGAFVTFLAPLVLYFVKKDQSKFVAFHAIQAVLFHFVISLGYIIAGFLCVFLIGFLLLPLVGLLSIVFSVIAALAANRGEWYELPLVGKIARQAAGV